MAKYYEFHCGHCGETFPYTGGYDNIPYEARCTHCGYRAKTRHVTKAIDNSTQILIVPCIPTPKKRGC